MHCVLQAGRLPPDSALPSFADIQSAVGFPEYYSEATRYAAQADDLPASTRLQEASPNLDQLRYNINSPTAAENEVTVLSDDEGPSSSAELSQRSVPMPSRSSYPTDDLTNSYGVPGLRACMHAFQLTFLHAEVSLWQVCAQ